MTCPDPKSWQRRRCESLIRRVVRKAWGYRPLGWAPPGVGLALCAALLVCVPVGVELALPEAEDGGATDTQRSGNGALQAGKKVPTKPPPNAKTECSKDERKVNGACYLILKAEPPCPENRYEHNGECLALVTVPIRNSVEE